MPVIFLIFKKTVKSLTSKGFFNALSVNGNNLFKFSIFYINDISCIISEYNKYYRCQRLSIF